MYSQESIGFASKLAKASEATNTAVTFRLAASRRKEIPHNDVSLLHSKSRVQLLKSTITFGEYIPSLQWAQK